MATSIRMFHDWLIQEIGVLNAFIGNNPVELDKWPYKDPAYDATDLGATSDAIVKWYTDKIDEQSSDSGICVECSIKQIKRLTKNDDIIDGFFSNMHYLTHHILEQIHPELSDCDDDKSFNTIEIACLFCSLMLCHRYFNLYHFTPGMVAAVIEAFLEKHKVKNDMPAEEITSLATEILYDILEKERKYLIRH